MKLIPKKPPISKEFSPVGKPKVLAKYPNGENYFPHIIDISNLLSRTGYDSKEISEFMIHALNGNHKEIPLRCKDYVEYKE